jgi:hypothetical protein
MVDLHCVRRKHAVLTDGQVIEIHCRWCSEKQGRKVIHRWRVDGGQPLVDRYEDGR